MLALCAGTLPPISAQVFKSNKRQWTRETGVRIARESREDCTQIAPLWGGYCCHSEDWRLLMPRSERVGVSFGGTTMEPPMESFPFMRMPCPMLYEMDALRLDPCRWWERTASVSVTAIGQRNRRRGLNQSKPPVFTGTAINRHQIVTGSKPANMENRASRLFSWRPRRDLNPCYRRERAVS